MHIKMRYVISREARMLYPYSTRVGRDFLRSLSGRCRRRRLARDRVLIEPLRPSLLRPPPPPPVPPAHPFFSRDQSPRRKSQGRYMGWGGGQGGWHLNYKNNNFSTFLQRLGYC